MSQITRSIILSLNVFALIIIMSLVPVQAQTQASCTFTYFSVPSPYNVSVEPNGINHYNTVVGQASSTSRWKGFIRYSNGAITLFSVPNSNATFLTRRNLNGTSVGYYTVGTSSTPPSAGLILTSSSYATLKYPGAANTFLSGINKWNSIVGSAADASGVYQGFKYSSGKFTSIKFPGAFSTSAGAINDNGVIIGNYVNGNLENPPQGFILHNGVYKSLNFVPSDINNAGTMVAGSSIVFSNGSIKTVHAPNSASTNLFGINDLGVVTGNANYAASGGAFTWKNFTAVCH